MIRPQRLSACIIAGVSPTDILDRIEDPRFKPFRLHVSDGTTVDVTAPRGVVVGKTSSLFVDRWGRASDGRPIAVHWRTIDNAHITQFNDLPHSGNGHRRRAGQ